MNISAADAVAIERAAIDLARTTDLSVHQARQQIIATMKAFGEVDLHGFRFDAGDGDGFPSGIRRCNAALEFLLARIDEDEQAARTAGDRHGGEWQDETGIVSGTLDPLRHDSWGPSSLGMYAPEGRWTLWDCEGASSLCTSPEASAHIARWDPARVLAECEAKRRIIELHRTYGEVYDRARMTYPEGADDCVTCGYGDEWQAKANALEFPDDSTYPCPTLRVLALSYIGHPDYREEWRP